MIIKIIVGDNFLIYYLTQLNTLVKIQRIMMRDGKVKRGWWMAWLISHCLVIVEAQKLHNLQGGKF